MLRVGPFVRIVAILLLSFAAMDLARPESCEDTAPIAAAQTHLAVADTGQAPGHGCEACFCCSRVVRAEFLGTFARVDDSGLRVSEAVPALVFTPVAPPYHPPLL